MWAAYSFKSRITLHVRVKAQNLQKKRHLMLCTNEDVKKLQTTDQISFQSLSDEASKHVSPY